MEKYLKNCYSNMMVHSILIAVIIVVLGLSLSVYGYKIHNVEDPKICNGTIYLEEGLNSAAILHLTSQPAYDPTPRTCTVTFIAPRHNWSGLMGVLEEVDLRRVEERRRSDAHTTHHDQCRSYHCDHTTVICVDYITVTSPGHKDSSNGGHSASPYRHEQCGSWHTNPDRPLPTIGDSKAENVRELKVLVVIGRRHEKEHLWKNYTNTRHKGFTFVVTAYSYSYGPNKCDKNLLSCGLGSPKDPLTFCIHDSLFCDQHVNCGTSHNRLTSMDERSCKDANVWSWLLTVLAGPWVGAGLLLLLVLGTVVYRNRARAARLAAAQQQQAVPPFNSYAESYEVSSHLPSNHHMAIQVRVVCNSSCHNWTEGPAHPPPHSRHWKPDMPPSYDALFPHGPPDDTGPATEERYEGRGALSPGSSESYHLHQQQSRPNSMIGPNPDLNSEQSTSAGHGVRFLGNLGVDRSEPGISSGSTQDVSSRVFMSENNVRYQCSRSLDRRIPICRELNTSSLLNQGVNITSPLADAVALENSTTRNSENSTENSAQGEQADDVIAEDDRTNVSENSATESNTLDHEDNNINVEAGADESQT